MEEIIIRICVLAIYVLVIIQVFSRYLFNKSIFWADPFARISLIWLTFFGASYALKKNQHVKMTNIANRFSPKVYKLIQIFIYIVMSLVLLFLIFYGFNLFFRFLPVRLMGTSISLAFLFLPIPISSFLMFLTCLDSLIKLFSS